MTTLRFGDFFANKPWHNDNESEREQEYLTAPRSSEMKGQLTDIKDIITYATAGNATLTLKSLKSGTRFTYKVKKPKGESKYGVAYWVSLMNGPDNESNFQFMGSIYKDNNYKISAKSRITKEAPSAVAFNWFWNYVVAQKRLPPNTIEVWHEGTCCRCGRKLTVPNSVKNGVGPECIKKMGV